MSSAIASEATSHKDAVRDEFTKQANTYAASPVITDAERLTRLVAAIDPAPGSRALEIATGPGHVAMALAARCREVVGIDLTPAPIVIAQRISRERGLTNVRFQLAEADNPPLVDGEFDIVVCRFAFHHFQHPATILAQMVRVCRPGGTIAVQDLYASESPQRAEYCNHVERLRDSSHTTALALSELVAMMGRAGLDIENLHAERLDSEMENWLATAPTPPDKAIEVRRLVDADMRDDLSGMRPYRRDGKVYFVQRIAALVCRKLG